VIFPRQQVSTTPAFQQDENETVSVFGAAVCIVIAGRAAYG
jgi:hypothetical protein